MHPLESSWPMFVALLAGGLAVAYAIWRPDFSVRVRNGRCRCKGNLPLVRQKALAQFLLHDLQPSGAITICGRVRKGRLQLWYFGRLTPGERQRIRNFLNLTSW